jgi:hypothetical protein
MTLHIFNPDHDLALASGLDNFTAPHAGRQLRHDLGWIAAFWARPGDAILVDDPVKARRAAARRQLSGRSFVTPNDLPKLLVDDIRPWGWNTALRSQLVRAGVSEHYLPSPSQLDVIRELSHRRTAAWLLPRLQTDGTIGEATECTTTEEVETLARQYGQIVAKAPWSCSGRGIRFIRSEELGVHDAPLAHWLQNTITRQGAVMVEPFYRKLRDFGAEFFSDGQGDVRFIGLSIFLTSNGAYTGNLIATETAKRTILSRYLSLSLLDQSIQRICHELGQAYKGKYCGPLGVDMMVCAGETHFLHPCVEINLRQTMGHAALSLSPNDDELKHVMSIEYDNKHYRLRIKRL